MQEVMSETVLTVWSRSKRLIIEQQQDSHGFDKMSMQAWRTAGADTPDDCLVIAPGITLTRWRLAALS